jgi:cyclase
VYTHGGRNATGIDVLEWAQRMEEYGAGEILLTSMDCDGTRRLRSPLTQNVVDAVSIPVIASGGVGNPGISKTDLSGWCKRVLVASIFHYREYTISRPRNISGRKMSRCGYEQF